MLHRECDRPGRRVLATAPIPQALAPWARAGGWQFGDLVPEGRGEPYGHQLSCEEN
jgi:hypothetical protein